MRLLSISLLFLTFSANLFSQSYPITIKVVDIESDSSIEGALVFIDELHFNDTQTDEYGLAFYENTPEGRVTINIRKPGYIPLRDKSVLGNFIPHQSRFSK